MPRRPLLAAPFAAAAVALALSDAPRLPAQPKPAAPAVPASYPTLTTPASLGGQRGKAVELVLTGTNLLDPTAVWLSTPAKVTVPPGQKDATKLKVKIELPADAPVGLHFLRVATAGGPSNLRPFVVDELPEVADNGKNKSEASPQTVPIPCVVVGLVEAESADFYKFPVTAGQPVTVEVLARRIGSALDPVVVLYDGTGKELGGVYADDTPGLQSDARVTFTPKSSGELIAEVRDSTYRGGPDYAYRLRVGRFPGATTAFPVAVQRGKTATVGFSGPDAAGATPVTVAAPADPAVPAVSVAPKRADGPSGWPVTVLLTDRPELVEAEPNGDPAKATVLPVPGGVSARFGEKNDHDHFRFAGKKGQKLTLQVLTYEVNAPTEVYLRVLDAKGKELAKSSPQQPGVKLDFDPPADGDYTVACEHLNYLSGPSEVYHLSVVPATADVEVSLGLDRADVPAGGVGVLPVVGVTRLNGLAGPVELSVSGADGLSGSLTIPAGAAPTAAAPLFLPLTAKAGTKPGLYPVTVVAKAGGVTRVATAFDPVKAALGNMPNPPAVAVARVAVAVVPPPPFSLAVTLDKSELPKGGSVKGKVTAVRDGQFADEIALTVVSAPANVTAKLAPVGKGKADAAFDLSAAAAAAPGPGTLLLRGTAKVNGKDVGVVAGPTAFTVTDAKKEPAKKK